MAKQTPKRLDAPTLAALHVITLAVGKTFYKEADAALDALLEQVKAGQIVTLPSERFISVPGVPPDTTRRIEIPVALRGSKMRVKDKFAKKNSIGVGLSARRYELEEVTTP